MYHATIHFGLNNLDVSSNDIKLMLYVTCKWDKSQGKVMYEK